ncbi:proline-rich protein 32 [Mus musculus]|uniref:Proline-rich protein 32 n=1 Tax=Mus musculus TaxID=10090 RepID=PRR32_MOUSE|nr:proline-rich protein 32 [Mus musculus]A2AFE9.1 RecName: Full=Proline-rich protein 32 [Mus musculus]EDL29048.1 mCG55068 [Mus musculus]|eukprot:NP_081117.1 proline-rich protein 32 [Mus musculus]
MACTENGLAGHSHSPIIVPVDKNRSKETCHNVQLRSLSSMLKDDEDDADVWTRPPVSLRPPFNVPRTGARIPQNPRAPRHPLTLTPAIEEESLATAEINSSEGLESQSQKGHDSINMSQEFSGSPMALMIGGPRVGSRVLERSGNNSKPYIPVPRSQGFFPPRGSQSRGPPYIPTLRSGIMMEVTPGNARMANRGNMAHVSFPLGSPRHPMDNWQQSPSLPLSPSITGLPCSSAHCFLPPQAPAFNPFPVMPTAFASPLRFGPPLLPYVFHYNTGAMYPPPYLN